MSVCITSAVNVRVKRPALIKFYCLGPNIFCFSFQYLTLSPLKTCQLDMKKVLDKFTREIRITVSEHLWWRLLWAWSSYLLLSVLWPKTMTNHESEISRIKSSKFDPKQVYATGSNGGGETRASWIQLWHQIVKQILCKPKAIAEVLFSHRIQKCRQMGKTNMRAIRG